MTNEQAQKVLDELQGVRPEVLTGEAKRLFEAIMKIADERDNLKEESEQKDKIIDLIAEKIFEEGIVWKNKEEVKQYFKNKAKEVK